MQGGKLIEMENSLEDHEETDSTIEEINSNIESFRSDQIEFIKEIGKPGTEEIQDEEEDNYSYEDFTDNDEEINQEINNANEDADYTQDDFDDDLVSNITSSKEDVLFHINFVQDSKNTKSMARTGTPASRNSLKKNLSFTGERTREIDRHNKILLKKILEKSASPGQISRDSSNTSIASSVSNSRASSAAINRKRDQKKIDYENQILMRKLHQIQRRKVTY